MAIISGGRINIWNAVKKQFEVVHPETEVARITDFADGIVQKLALTSAMTAVTALQTDSWFGKLLKMALTASGVKYSIAQNGYVCLGSLFGGLIIQWGIINLNVAKWTYSYPIDFKSIVLTCGATDVGSGTYPLGFGTDSLSKFTIYWNNTKNDERVVFHWFAIGV